ncbi:hypothetical protein GCM10027295_21900 [Pseudaeromonas pectinilytica]
MQDDEIAQWLIAFDYLQLTTQYQQLAAKGMVGGFDTLHVGLHGITIMDPSIKDKVSGFGHRELLVVTVRRQSVCLEVMAVMLTANIMVHEINNHKSMYG